MKKLAEEYALARLQGRLSGNEVSFSDKKVFTEEDIEAAFNAGRESVVENIPDLEFKQTKKGGFVAENTVFYESYHLCCKATTGKWSFCMEYETPIEWYDTREEAEQAANEDYKKRIKKALLI
nr:MAG TPA: hypothetical protein [Caudoviricetes sp.]